MGRVKKILKAPLEWSRDWRSAVSMIGPMTMAKRRGVGSNLVLRIT